MDSLLINAHGKINLILEVGALRDDGFHEVSMLMQEVELCDSVSLQILPDKNGQNVCVCSIEELSGRDNLACKAADLMQQTFGLPPVRIDITKRIPIAAGMGGGSSDAAAVIEGMSRLFDLSVSREEKEKLGAKLGSDIPFFFTGGTAAAKGRGEVIVPCPDLGQMPVLLIKPDFGVSTPEAYRLFDASAAEQGPDLEVLAASLEGMDAARLAGLMMNHLEKAIIHKHPVIADLKTGLLKQGASGAMMTGSGPTVFGIFSDRKPAAVAKEWIESQYPSYQCVLTWTKKRMERGA